MKTTASGAQPAANNAATKHQHGDTQSKAILLLADDDVDDCMFFQDALEELPITVDFRMVRDGEQLMTLLSGETIDSPHVLFLDLNMPRKNGFECLAEIRLNNRFMKLPVIVFSTSFDQDVVNMLYQMGAHYYIRKPTDFSQLKKVVYQALVLATQEHMSQPAREDFVLKGELEAIQP